MLATFAFLHPDDFLVRLLGIVPRFLSFFFSFDLRIINKKLFLLLLSAVCNINYTCSWKNPFVKSRSHRCMVGAPAR